MAYIAHRGVNGSTAVNIAINVIQISALLVFSVMALGYRMNHPPGSVAFQFDPQTSAAYTYEFATTKTMVSGARPTPLCATPTAFRNAPVDAAGKPVPYHISYPETDSSGAFRFPSQRQFRGPHAQLWLDVRSGHESPS